MKEFEEMENRMKKNAWYVAKTLVDRIDGAPVLGEQIKEYLSEDKQEHFFFNRNYLLQYHSASTPTAKNSVPGSAYFEKILKFFNDHYKVGELFLAFLRTGRKDEYCGFCLSWSGLPTERVPQPVPDPLQPSHYMEVSETPTHAESGGLATQSQHNQDVQCGHHLPGT